jgi:RNA polymerase sigma-70 factor (ECF subfamily)
MTDTAPFEAFVREYQDMVYAVAVRLLANPAEAEDVSQTVFMRAFEHFEALDQNPAAPGWLKTVATNLCLNHLSRYRSRWRFFSELVSDDRNTRDPIEALPAADGSVFTALEEADRRAALERALRRLPAHQRVPIVLFHFEHKTYQEIADLLGVSLAKVKSDMHRGRDALRSVLTPSHGTD